MHDGTVGTRTHFGLVGRKLTPKSPEQRNEHGTLPKGLTLKVLSCRHTRPKIPITEREREGGRVREREGGGGKSEKGSDTYGSRHIRGGRIV